MTQTLEEMKKKARKKSVDNFVEHDGAGVPETYYIFHSNDLATLMKCCPKFNGTLDITNSCIFCKTYIPRKISNNN
jgi:hypothetical protein